SGPSGIALTALTEEIVAYEHESDETQALRKQKGTRLEFRRRHKKTLLLPLLDSLEEDMRNEKKVGAPSI
ncbi:hypothetical protein Tco_0899720, partial [Tanacetum coccineum]